MNRDDIRTIIVDTGKKLLSDNLTVRTWGNVSARIDAETCAITPSGYNYNKLQATDIVIADINTFEYKGHIKPSSELHLHCGIYQTKPDVNFIIHTHQKFASVLSCSSSFLEIAENDAAFFLGSVVPVVQYAESGTALLAHNTINTFRNYQTSSILLSNHGAVCCGTDSTSSYERIKLLEDISKKRIFSKLPEIAIAYNKFFDNEFNRDAYFCGRCFDDESGKNCFIIYDSKKKSKLYKVCIRSGKIITDYANTDNSELRSIIPFFCRIFELCSDVNFIAKSEMPASGYFSINNRAEFSIPVFLDDFAQICGEEIRCMNTYANTSLLVDALSKTNVIILNGVGLFYYCREESDMFPIREIAEKNILTFLSAKQDKTFTPIDGSIVKKMHKEYLEDYSLRINSL